MSFPKLLAEGGDNGLGDLFGKVKNPGIGVEGDDPITSLVKLLNLGLNIILIVAGLFTLINFIMAGFQYMTAGGDAKKVGEAQTKIMFTAIGLAIVVIAPVLASIVGYVMFGRWDAILNPCIKTINDFSAGAPDPCR
jgi:hypothetical protein